jgi:hypothetical protein
MKNKSKIRVSLTDHMVLLGFGLAAVYWILDSILYIFLDYRANILYRFFGVNLSEVWTRLVVTCLFVIFGSHAQYTINKRRVVEEELQENEKKYRTIVENIDDGFFEVTKTGQLTFYNDSLRRILGLSDEDLLDKSLPELLDAASSETFRACFNPYERAPNRSARLTAPRWTPMAASGLLSCPSRPSSISVAASLDSGGYSETSPSEKRRRPSSRKKWPPKAPTGRKANFLPT